MASPLLTLHAATGSYERSGFSLPGNRTSRVRVRVSSQLEVRIRRHHGVSAIVTAVTGPPTFSQKIVVKIL
jgi:hypothetical protein